MNWLKNNIGKILDIATVAIWLCIMYDIAYIKGKLDGAIQTMETVKKYQK